MNTSSSISPFFRVFKAAQVKLGDRGFLSKDVTCRDMILNRSDVHHVYPRNYLKQQGLKRGRYNQIANYALTQTEINIAISDKSPEVYFSEVIDQCGGGSSKYGRITSKEDLAENFAMNCIPSSLLEADIPSYDDFLVERRHLMASRIKLYFETL